MYIKGVTEYDRNGKEIKTACIIGKATKDGEIRETSNGREVASVSVKAFGKKDGSAEFVTVKAWDGPFLRAVGNTVKGDSMMVCGRLDEREYNGKTYVDMIADYYIHMPAVGDTKQNFEGLQNRVNNFNAVDEDSDLPF